MHALHMGEIEQTSDACTGKLSIHLLLEESGGQEAPGNKFAFTKTFVASDAVY